MFNDSVFSRCVCHCAHASRELTRDDWDGLEDYADVRRLWMYMQFANDWERDKDWTCGLRTRHHRKYAEFVTALFSHSDLECCCWKRDASFGSGHHVEEYCRWILWWSLSDLSLVVWTWIVVSSRSWLSLLPRSRARTLTFVAKNFAWKCDNLNLEDLLERWTSQWTSQHMKKLRRWLMSSEIVSGRVCDEK